MSSSPPEPESTPEVSAGGSAGGSAAADGRATRWTGQQERRRVEFTDAALRAIAQHGPDVSTEQIAAEAGVARTRLYRHFAGATALNQAIAARAEQMVVEALAPSWDPSASPATIIRTAVSAHLAWLTGHHDLYRYLVRHSVITSSGESAVNDVKKLIADHLINLLTEFVTLLDIDEDVVRPLAFGLVGFVDAAADQWVTDPREVTLEEMVELVSSWIWSVIDNVLRSAGIEADPAVPLLPGGH